jgi:hypothetical protein
MTRIGLRALGMLIATITAVTLAGCASIPHSGDVKQGGALSQADTTTVEFFPAGPAADASPEQILRGFVEAATGPQNDYAVARSFLTTEFQSKWDPNLSVTVDTGSRDVVMTSATSAVLTLAAVAGLDATGQYSSSSSPVTRSQNYSFTQVKGQWRISSAPAGVVIDRGIFEQVYTTHPLYFFEQSFRYLVPDMRWFARGSATTTRMVKALLAGPAGWLAEGGGVVSAFPANTALVASAVPILKNVAVVDLAATASGVDALTILRMRQQLTASLQGVNDVTSVDILSEGVPVSQAGSAYVDSALPMVADGRPFVVSDKGTGFVDGDAISATAVSSSIPAETTAISLSAGGRSAAILMPGGVALARAATTPALLDTRPGLIAPTLDVFAFTWSVPAATPTQLVAYGSDGRAFPVAVPWTAATSIRSLKMSHDGSRLLAIVETKSGAAATATIEQALVVASVVRGENSAPVRLGGMITLAAASGTVVDAAWVDATTVISTASTGLGTPFVTSTVLTQVIGGKSQNVIGFSQGTPVSIAGANNLSQVRILLADGKLLTLRNNTVWLSTFSGVRVLATTQ